MRSNNPVHFDLCCHFNIRTDEVKSLYGCLSTPDWSLTMSIKAKFCPPPSLPGQISDSTYRCSRVVLLVYIITV